MPTLIPETWVLLLVFADGSYLYTIPVQDLYKDNIPTWSGNRWLDKDHVAALRDSVRDVSVFDGVYTLADIQKDDDTWSLELIDGQHRREALLYDAHGEQLPHVQNSSQRVVVRVYHNLTERQVPVRFDCINNAKPMQYKGSPEQKSEECVDRCLLSWPGCIKAVEKTNKRYRPKLRLEDWRKQIRRVFKKTDHSVDAVMEALTHINKELVQHITHLQTQSVSVRVQDAVYQQCSLSHDIIASVVRDKFALGVYKPDDYKLLRKKVLEFFEQTQVQHQQYVSLIDL